MIYMLIITENFEKIKKKPNIWVCKTGIYIGEYFHSQQAWYPVATKIVTWDTELVRGCP